MSLLVTLAVLANPATAIEASICLIFSFNICNSDKTGLEEALNSSILGRFEDPAGENEPGDGESINGRV